MDNFDLMRERLHARGGVAQQARMIQDKKETLKRTIKYSYQGAQVQAVGKTEIAGALINPNAAKQDYDDKVISIDFDHGYSVGTVFEWLNTGTKWLIYLQDLTELAYFKGDIRKCNYEIKWKEDGEIYTTYAALTGPSEKKLESAIKEGISIDSPNYSLHFYIPNNAQTLQHFDRYTKFYLQGLSTCWQVEAIDKISMPGILEVYAYEYYVNEHEDNVEKGLVGDLIVKDIIPEEADIFGDVFIKPRGLYEYKYIGKEPLTAEWAWDTTLPIEASVSGTTITITWDASYSYQFDLYYGDIKKTIVVESLF